jgi:hypothetical protein
MDRIKSHVSLFVSPELRDALERSAAQNDRSLSAEVRCAIREYTSRPSGSPPPIGNLRPEGQEALP